MNLNKDLSFSTYSKEEHFLDALAGNWFQNQISVINYFALAKYRWQNSIYSIKSLKDTSEDILANRAEILSIRKNVIFKIYFGKHKWMIRAAYIIENNSQLVKDFFASDNETSSDARFTFYFHLKNWLFRIQKENPNNDFINNWINDIRTDLIRYEDDFKLIESNLNQSNCKTNENHKFIFNQYNLNANIFQNINVFNNCFHLNSELKNNFQPNGNKNTKERPKQQLKKFENYFVGKLGQQNYIVLIDWLKKADIIIAQNNSDKYLWIKEPNSNIHIGVLFFLLEKFEIMDLKKHDAVQIMQIFNNQFEFEQKPNSLVKQFQDRSLDKLEADYKDYLLNLNNKYFSKFENLKQIFKK